MILAGVSFIAINRYISNLQIMEMDNTAKEIFIVAQNNLSKYYVSGEFDRELENGSKVDFGTKFSDKPNYIIDSIPGNDHEFYYVPYDASQPELKPKILKVMLPEFSIDKEVSVEGNYVIIYDAKTATVLGVFYSGKTHTYFGPSNVDNPHVFSSDEVEAFDESNTVLLDVVNDVERRDNNGTIIGRHVYGGKDVRVRY